MRLLARLVGRAVLAVALLAGVPACHQAEAGQGFARRAAGQQYVATVVPIGDSIVFGVNAETKAGWREQMFALAAATTGTKLYFAGTQSYAGNGNGMAGDPWNEGYPGRCLRSAPGTCNQLAAVNAGNRGATIAIVAGGTNDMASNVLGDSAATAVSSMSTFVDIVWAQRTSPRYQIVVFEVLQRLDADDTKVQAFNAALPAMIAGKSYWQNITLCPGTYGAITRKVVGQGYSDPVHPLDEGYTDMANTAWPCVRQAINATMN